MECANVELEWIQLETVIQQIKQCGQYGWYDCPTQPNYLTKKILFNALTVEKFTFYIYYPSIHRHALRLCMSKVKISPVRCANIDLSTGDVLKREWFQKRNPDLKDQLVWSCHDQFLDLQASLNVCFSHPRGQGVAISLVLVLLFHCVAGFSVLLFLSATAPVKTRMVNK